MVLSVKRATSGAETTQVMAKSPLLDLANGVIQRTEAEGTVTLLFTLLGLTLGDLVDVIMDDAPTNFSRGVIQDEDIIIEVFTFDLDNPLSALQELADLAGKELAVRRDGDSGFLVDLVDQAGAFDTYGEIRQTVTDDMLMGESAPTTNFGGGLVFSVQRGPGGTDTSNGLKFDLRWMRGLPVKIIDARLILTGNGVGGGTSHVVTLTALRSASSGPFSGQPREIKEFETTWDDHVTGRAWASGGARGTNDDRDDSGSGIWSATRADNTVAGETVSFEDFSDTSILLEDFLQTVVDGTDAFYKDGLARFVFDASPSGQSGKVGQYHTDDAVLFANRPMLLLTLAQDTPHFVFQKNLIGIARETDERELANRVYAVGGGGPEQGIRLTLGKARWTVATVPTTTTFTITDTAIFEDTHLEGNFVDPLDGSGPFLITATEEVTQLVTTSVAHGMIVGDVFAFRLNATDELVFVESPSSQANFGVVHGTQVENDLPIVDNLVENAALRDFTGSTPDNWTALGGATLAQETDPIHTQIAQSAVKVTTGAAVGDGIISDAITLAPVGASVFFSATIFLFVESGDGVEIFLEHSVDGRFPLEGANEAAFTTQLGVFIQVSIEGVEFSAGLLTINVVNKEATAGVFYLDGAQLINLAQQQPFFETRSSVLLWQRALDVLTLKSVPKITHRLPQALDLTGLDDSTFPYDQVVLGCDVFVDDRRLEIDDLVTRVLRLREELLQSSILRMELSNTLDTLIDQLAARERRTRQIEPPPIIQQGFQAVTLSVIDTGEVLVAVTGGDRMRSYKFLVKLDSPETYDAVVAAGDVSNVIDGSAVFTGFFMETGDLALLRAVAYKQVSAGGQPGATEVRAVSLTAGTTSLVRARVEVLADFTQFTASSAAPIAWDDEVYDVGNLHNASSPELLTLPISGVYLFAYAIAWDVSSGAGDRRQGVLVGSGPARQPGASIDYNKPGIHTGIGFALLMGSAAAASRAMEAEILNATGADITVFSADSFFQAIRIAVRGDQHRVWVQPTIHSIADATTTVVSFSLASDVEVVDVGDMFDKAGAPTRFTFQRAVPYLVICGNVWRGQGAGVGTPALRRTDLNLTISGPSTSRFARSTFQEIDGLAAGDLFAQCLAKFIEPAAGDFMEVEVRQESGGAIDWGSAVSGGIKTAHVQALELPGGSNPRASVSLTANEATVTATPLAIPWDTEDIDTDAMVDIGGAPTRITIVTDGVYTLIAQIGFAAAATGIRRIAIKLGASVDVATKEIDDPDGLFIATVMVTMPAFAGDFFEVEVEQASGGALDVLSSDSFFQAIRVGNQ